MDTNWKKVISGGLTLLGLWVAIMLTLPISALVIIALIVITVLFP